MPTFSFGLGKGLREPCSPYRTAYYFGAPLNEPDANYWNCNPEVVQPATTYDLRTISENSEVCVALLNVKSANMGSNTVTFTFRRERDNRQLFRFNWTNESLAGGWFYSYAYIGFVSWEIYEDGRYIVDVVVTGANPYSNSIVFTITGVTITEPEPPPVIITPTPFIEAFNSVSAFFYQAYVEVLDWPWPFYNLAGPLYSLAEVASSIAWAFVDLGEWISAVANAIMDFLTWESIRDLIRSWLPGIDELVAWFSSWWGNVTDVITNWWSVKWYELQDWFNARLSWIDDMQVAWTEFWNIYWPYFQDKVDWLGSRIDEFFTETVPNLINWDDISNWWAGAMGEVQGIVDSAFEIRESLWAGWTDFRDQVAELFEDPEKWLLDKIESMIVRYL